MPEVVEIRRPDQLRLPPPERPPRQLPWRPIAGVILLAVLASAAAWAMTRPKADEPAVTPATTHAPSASVAVAPQVDPETLAVTAALEAWERFAQSGDVSSLRDTFDEAGPQFRRFQDEAASLRKHPATGLRLVLRSSERKPQAGHDLVFATAVEIVRSAAETELVEWDFVLRSSEGAWKVWTVRGAVPELVR